MDEVVSGCTAGSVFSRKARFPQEAILSTGKLGLNGDIRGVIFP
ncbi:hypothetical protein [Streptomyces sp. NPDC018000]